MSKYLGVVPAYGRDYKSKAAVIRDWKEGKDFIISDAMHRDGGRYINVEDAKRMGPMIISARYDNRRKTCVFEVSP